MTVRRPSRRFLPVLLALMFAAAMFVPAAASSASATTTGQAPYGIPWKLGTPLPVLPGGYTVEAWPSQASMAGIQPNTQIHMTPVTMPTDSTPAAAASAESAATTALAPNANSAGYVNLWVIPGSPDVCTPMTFIKNEGKFVNAVAQSYVRDPKDNVQFTYGKGESSSIAVGVSLTNGYGSFSFSYDTSVATTGNEGYPYEIGAANTYWRTFWEWGKYEETCGQGTYTTYYYTMPYAWEPNDNEYHPGFDGSYQNCWPEEAGSKPDMGTQTATTITAAFTDTYTGFSGSSQTGYDTNADLTFYYGEKGWLCGNVPPKNFGYPVAIP